MAMLSTFDAMKRLAASETVDIDEAQLRQLQLTLLGIVRDVFACCERHGLTCVLGGGSALGAVRHGGFIPWDDDVDLNIPRADYEKFVEIFVRDYGDRYWVHTPRATHNLGLGLARLRLKGTSVITREDVACKQKECGAFVDLFIVENTFDNLLLRGLHGVVSMGLGLLYSCRKAFFERRTVSLAAVDDKELKRTLRGKRFVGALLAVLPLDFWVRLWDCWNKLCTDDRSKWVTIPVGRRHFWGEMCPRGEMCESREIVFENLKARAPARVEDYLRRNYGCDYMTPPPAAARERHAFYRPFDPIPKAKLSGKDG